MDFEDYLLAHINLGCINFKFFEHSSHVLQFSSLGFCIYIKIQMRPAAAEDILKFTCICVCVCIYLCICLCHVSWPNEKRYRPEIWHTYSHLPYLKMGFLFFRRNPRDGR